MTEPTDAELDELRQVNSGRLNFVTLSEFRTIARAALAKWGVQPSPASQGDTQIAPADVLLRTAIAETLYQQVRIEHDNRIGPWSAFDVREQQRIVDSIQGLCSVFAPASQGDTEDTARLDWLESNSQINIERVRYLGADESIYEVTTYNSTDYNGETLRKAIDAARKQGAKAVAWARPVFATEAVEPFDKGDLVDIEFYNHPERPEGEGWRPLVFADTDDAARAAQEGK